MSAESSSGGIPMALALYDLSISMYRQRLRNDRPELSEAEIDAVVAGWLERRPGAELGDMANGVVSDRLS
ncbi:MAG: hypothetical protein ACT4PP_09690 [Sporichthyaceae bacterium]